MIITYLLQPLLNSVKRLVPGNSLPFALASFSYPLQGIFQTVGMIHILRKCKYSRTGPALIPGMIFITLNLDYLAAVALYTPEAGP